MLSREQTFRLTTVALLGVVFTAAVALAEKNSTNESNKETNKAVMSVVNLIQEAELINSGALHPSVITKIGSNQEK